MHETRIGDPTATAEALRTYTRAKQRVGRLLGEVGRVLEAIGGNDDRIHEVLSRLAEDRFNLVVLGEFKRGKSSLINAIVGRALLPVAAVPLTSIVTAVRNGPIERVRVRRVGVDAAEDVTPAALGEYVTERGNPGNAKGIASAEVEAPSPFLRPGLSLVDTPGVGSAHEQNTAITLAFLPDADAAVFVTSAEAPLSSSELSFLDTVRCHVRKLFFVVNKIDVLPQEERPEVLRFVEETLAARVGAEAPMVFPVSARAALAAKAAGNLDGLASSGLPLLEQALAGFLDRDRRRVFLAAGLDRAERLIAAGLLGLGVRERQTAPESGPVRTALRRRLEELATLRRSAVAQARQRVAEWVSSVLGAELERFTADSSARVLAELRESPSTGRLGSQEYFERLRASVRKSLAAQASAWQEAHRASVDAFTETVTEDLGAALAKAVAEIADVAADTLGVPRQPLAEASGLSRRAPRSDFAPGAAEEAFTAAGPFAADAFLPGPAFLGRRLARFLVRRSAPAEVRRVARWLEERVLAHVESRLSERELAGNVAAEREERRLGLVSRGVQAASADGLPLLRARLEALALAVTRMREAILEHRDDEAAQDPALPESNVVAATAERRERPSRRRLSLDVATCPVCSQVLDAVFDFLTRFQYTLATDRRTQAGFRDSGGFCALHTWQLETLASPRGLCSGYPELLERTAGCLGALLPLPPADAADRVVDLVPDAASCEPCRIRSSTERRAIEALSAALEGAEGRTRYERSRGLCLPHLAQAVAKATQASAAVLLRQYRRRCGEVADALRGYALKFDARRQELLSRDEERAYRDAVVLTAGEQRVF